MKITNWFLKGLTKYGRTERFPKAESKNVFEVNKVLKPLKFRPFKEIFLHLSSGLRYMWSM